MSKMSTKALLALVLLVVVACLSLAQGLMAPLVAMRSESGKNTCAPKRGRIVASYSLNGVAGAEVTEVGYYFADLNKFSLFAALYLFLPSTTVFHEGLLFRRTAYTDENGYFTFPDTCKESLSALESEVANFRNLTFSVSFRLSVLKVGYTMAGSSALVEFDSSDNPIAQRTIDTSDAKIAVSYDPPSARFAANVLNIDAVRLVDLNASPRQEAYAYYTESMRASQPAGEFRSSSISPARSEVINRLLALACERNPTDILGYVDITAYLYFARKPTVFLLNLRQLDPEGFQSGLAAVVKPPAENPTFTAGHVCASFSESIKSAVAATPR